MAVTCARCGTQNPDGNQFCQACGTPLAVAAAPPPLAGAFAPPGSAIPGPPAGPPLGPPSGPPQGPPPPPPPPGAYQSPYYAASAVGPQPPVHRTPWMLIISAIVVLVVLMAGCGTAIAVLGNRNGGNQGGSSGILPSPSPAGTPATPSPASSGGTTASNKGETIAVPPGWTVSSKDDESITLTNPNGDGSVTIGSGPSSPAQTAQQNKDSIDKFFTGKYPDTKNCTGSKTTNGNLGTAPGIYWELCFTLSAGGQSIQAGAPMFAGANSDGSVYYVALLLTSQSNMKSFIADAAPILQSVQWRLT